MRNKPKSNLASAQRFRVIVSGNSIIEHITQICNRGRKNFTHYPQIGGEIVTVYDNIKTLCNERGISIPRLEKDIGLSERNTYKWRDHVPSAAIVKKIAEYFGVPMDRIMEGVEWEGNNGKK